jgi:catechol 2,3-dioxygenase-like lactoylglutathione lyase family enzyme
LELIAFPPGRGPVLWRDIPRNATGVGLDHSAISVADAGRSAAFYEGVLGLSCTARQVNRSPEQERLDAAAGAVVDVLAFDPAQAATPHIELLSYRAPRGRPMPAGGLRANDVAAMRLVLQVGDLGAMLEALGGEERLAFSRVATPKGAHAALARDPDGHLIELVEERAKEVLSRPMVKRWGDPTLTPSVLSVGTAPHDCAPLPRLGHRHRTQAPKVGGDSSAPGKCGAAPVADDELESEGYGCGERLIQDPSR